MSTHWVTTNPARGSKAPTHAYTWDRANRLRSMGGLSYAYDGLGHRVEQGGNGVDVTQYLLDAQPGLAVVLSATTGADTTRYVHGPRGNSRAAGQRRSLGLAGAGRPGQRARRGG